MKKLATYVAAACLLSGALAVSTHAQHRAGRQRGHGHAQPAEAPQSEHIAEALGDLHWGMSQTEVLTYFQNKIRENYRPQLAKAPGAIEEDRLRAQMGDELRQLRESQVCFGSEHNGWDASFIQDEFTHNNNECMLVQHDVNSQNFYFFIQGHLWKWYKAFDASVFEGQTFAQFSEAIQGRFGHAREVTGELVQGRGQRHWLEWQDETSRLRAIDQTHFYGFFCLVFESKETVNNLATLRRNVPPPRDTGHALVDAVTSGQGETANPDQNGDIVDRITGHIRNRQDAPAGTTGHGTTGTTGSTGTTGTTGHTGTTTTTTAHPPPGNDPFAGVDL